MAPRGYDRYMIVVGAGSNRKFVRLTDSERCAHFLGILSIAAQSPRRGYLLISEGIEAHAEEIAAEASVTVKAARSTMEKLRRVGVLERDDEAGAWFVHDWWEVNPNPRPDPTNAARQANYRARNGGSNAGSNAPRNGDVTASNAPEVEVEVEVEGKNNNSTPSPSSGDGKVQQVFDAWLTSTGRTSRTLLDPKRRRVIANALKPYPLPDVIDAVNGWRFSPHHRGENATGTVYNDIELLLRDAKQIEKFRDLSRGATHLAGQVVPIRKPGISDLIVKLRNNESEAS